MEEEGPCLMIVVVAPYTPIANDGTPFLGGARKLEMVINLLGRIDEDIVLINSAHNGTARLPLHVGTTLIGDVSVREMVLSRGRNRQLGKLRNLMEAGKAAKALLKMGLPRMIWLYNAYAFECLFARRVREYCDCPVVLEFEDWHFSRSRGWNPKPYLDYLAWRLAARRITHVFAVNNFLSEKMKTVTGNRRLLPGIVANELIAKAKKCPPFRADHGKTVIGYFGGLTIEKGADYVLRLVDDLPPNYLMEVSGGGELEGEFAQRSRKLGARMRFHGKVDDRRLYELMGNCDVILNPHSSIAQMGNGVFPFKVIEAIASGRLLISTPLPTAGLEGMLDGVSFSEGHYGDFLDAVLRSRETYDKHQELVGACARRAGEVFGEDAVMREISRIIYAAET